MLNSPLATNGNKNYISTAAASFVGIMAAIPLSFALFSPDNRAGAVNDTQTGTAQEANADYAQYAYAYTQGYLAKTASAHQSPNNSGTCANVTATTASDGDHATTQSNRPVGGFGSVVAIDNTSVTPGNGNVNPITPAHGGGSGGSGGSGGGNMMSADDWESVINNSYNEYYSHVSNSVHNEITNTNSNNVVGSHNSTATVIGVEDADDVTITTENTNSAHNVVATDSYNNGSYNQHTETNTTIIDDSYNNETTTVTNDSFNQETTLVKDSYNNDTTTETNTTVVNDSFNKESTSNTTTNETNTTIIDKSDNSTESTTTLTDSGNTTTVTDSYNDNSVEERNRIEGNRGNNA